MTKTILVALAVLPLAAFAQAPTPGAGPAPRGGAAAGPRGGTGPGGWKPEFAMKRMQLARNLGLAEALDLDTPQALKLSEQLDKLDQKRLAIFQQMRDAHQVLRRAAQGEKATAAEVDQAITKALDARTQMHALDRETLQTVTQGLSPEKKARAVLFLARFEHRFRGGPGMGMGPGGRGGRGAGMGRGGGMGPGAGMGPGMAGGDCPNCPWHEEHGDED